MPVLAFAHSIVEAVPHPLVILDGELRIEEANPAFFRTFGGYTSDARGRPIDQWGDVWKSPELHRKLEGVLLGESFENVVVQRALGAGKKVIRLSARRIAHDDGSPVVMVTVEDATEQLEARERLERLERLERRNRELERRLTRHQAVIASMTDGVIIADAQGNLLEWNDAALAIHGYESAAEVRKPLSSFADHYELTTLDDSPVPLSDWPMARVLRGNTLTDYELRVRRTDTASEKYISYTGAPVFDAQGRVELAVLTLRDFTDRRRAEVALRLRDRAIHTISQGIVITDAGRPDNPMVFVNPGMLALTGHLRSELIGRNSRMLQGPDTDPLAIERLRRAVAEGQPCTVELLNHRKDGSAFWNELSIAPVRDDQGRVTHYVGVQNDVTQRRLLQDRYHQTQKMEAVGQLASGVAHDFNNLLTVINGYSDLLLEAMETSDGLRSFVEAIAHAGERSATLTRQLLVFSRPEAAAPEVFDLNDAIADAEKLLRRVIREDTRLEMDVATAGRAGEGRSIATRASPRQPGNQRARRHAARGYSHDRNRRRGARRSLFGNANRRVARSLRAVVGFRHRLRHVGRGQVAGLRAVLYDQGAGQGNGAGLVRRPQHRQAGRRPDRHRHRAGRRHDVHRLSPPGQSTGRSHQPHHPLQQLYGVSRR